MTLKTFHIGVKGIIVANGKVRLLQRENAWSGRFWELPGGRMEENEEIEQTLRRELREELPSIGRIAVGQLLHAARVPDEMDEIGLILLYYRVVAELPRVELSDEHIGHTWADADDLAMLERGQGDTAIFAYTLTAARAALDATRGD